LAPVCDIRDRLPLSRGFLVCGRHLREAALSHSGSAAAP